MTRPGPKPRDPAERFFKMVEKTDSCWLWTGGKTPGGYGKFWNGKREEVAHRFAYRLLAGAFDETLDLDHLCRVRHCVNPAHLEPVTRSVNLRRGELAGPLDGGQGAARQRAKTQCPQGHEYTPENTYVLPSRPTARYCRRCHLLSTRARRSGMTLSEYVAAFGS